MPPLILLLVANRVVPFQVPSRGKRLRLEIWCRDLRSLELFDDTSRMIHLLDTAEIVRRGGLEVPYNLASVSRR